MKFKRVIIFSFVLFAFSCQEDKPITLVKFDNIVLSSQYVVPKNNSTSKGSLSAAYFVSKKKLVINTLTFEGFTPTAIHFHINAAEGQVVYKRIEVAPTGAQSSFVSPMSLIETRELTSEEEKWLLANRWYIDIHSAENTSGEIRGQLVRSN
jgi:hypothetical protein